MGCPTSGPAPSALRETDTHDHGEDHSRVHGQRTAERTAACFLRSLRPGMRVLFCGCRPGSVTIGLARRVAPAVTSR
jgi:hypothetical protein